MTATVAVLVAELGVARARETVEEIRHTQHCFETRQAWPEGKALAAARVSALVAQHRVLAAISEGFGVDRG